MTPMLTTFALPNRPKRNFLLFILILLSQFSFSQKSAMNTESIVIYKNAVKGFIIPTPFYSTFSLGYERYISVHSLVEIVTNNQFYLDEMGVPYYTLCIMPAYKYLTISQNKGFSNFWLSAYLMYRFQKDFHHENGIETNCTLYHYGIGLSIGKKIYISQNKSWFLDIGLGISNNMYHEIPIFSTSDWMDTYFGEDMLVRPIVQFAKKF